MRLAFLLSVSSLWAAATSLPALAAPDAAVGKSRLPDPSAMARKLVPPGAVTKPPPKAPPRPRGKNTLPGEAPPTGEPPARGAGRAAAGSATGPAATRTRIEHMLRATKTPPTEVELGTAGGAVDDALIAVASDANVELPVRTRAVSALAYTPTRTARTFLMTLIRNGGAIKTDRPRPARGSTPTAANPTAPSNGTTADAGVAKAANAPEAAAAASSTGTPSPETTANTLLRRAAVTLGWIGGPLAPSALAPVLDHADPDVRADAAVGLALTRLPAAADLLRARLPRETDPRVRGHLARQLNVIEAALAAPTPTPPNPLPPNPGPAPLRGTR